MADQNEQQNPPDGAQNTGQHESGSIPYARFKEVNDERKALEARLAKLEKAQTEADQTRLAEEKRYQELADSYKAELDRVKPVAGQIDDWKAALHETAKAQIDLLPEDARELVPEYDDPRLTLAWLNKNAAKLMRPAAPAMDAGTRGDSAAKNVKLTADQERALMLARQVDPTMTRERYIARLLMQQDGG